MTIHKVLDISTAHVSQWVRDNPDVAFPHGYSVGSDECSIFVYRTDDDLDRLIPSVRAVMIKAQQLDCPFILLDPDADERDDLRVYDDWEEE